MTLMASTVVSLFGVHVYISLCFYVCVLFIPLEGSNLPLESESSLSLPCRLLSTQLHICWAQEVSECGGGSICEHNRYMEEHTTFLSTQRQRGSGQVCCGANSVCDRSL